MADETTQASTEVVTEAPDASEAPGATEVMLSTEVDDLDEPIAEPKEGEEGGDAAATTAAGGAAAFFDEMTIIALWTLFCTIRILMSSFGRHFGTNFWRR